MATKTVNPTEVQKYLSGIDFPADKAEIISYAKSKGAPNEVIDALNGLPDMDYNNSAEISSQFGGGGGKGGGSGGGRGGGSDM